MLNAWTLFFASDNPFLNVERLTQPVLHTTITMNSKSIYATPSELSTLYKIECFLGSGGFGSVFTANRIRDNSLVVMKIVNEEEERRSGDNDTPHEAVLLKLAASVPGVPKLLDYRMIECGYALITEPFGFDPDNRDEGLSNVTDLYDYVKDKNGLKEAEAAELFKAFVDIIVDLTHANVLHRDLKPENCLLDLKTRRLALIDFGVATIRTSGFYHSFQGTTCFGCPPEMYSKKKYTAEGQNVWSLGCFLYSLVFIDPPFESPLGIIAGKPQFGRKRLSSAFKNLVSGCLQKNPEKRLTLAQVHGHQWMTQFDEHPNACIGC